MKYYVRITETWQCTVEVEASDEETAMEEVQQRHINDEFELSFFDSEYETLRQAPSRYHKTSD